MMAIAENRPLRVTRILLAASVAALFVIKFRLLWTLNVSWDEFIYLSKLYEAARGDLHRAFQNFYVHLFGWVTSVPGDEIDQIMAGRLVAYVLQALSAVCVFLIANRLCGRTAAWFALVCSLTFSFVLRHGDSFRADPIISFLFLVCVAFLVLGGAKRSATIAAAAALAMAGLISIKSVFYLPTVAVILGYGVVAASGRRAAATRLALFAGVGLFLYFVSYAIHTLALSESPSVSTTQRVAEVGERMLFAPNIKTLKTTLALDWLFWLLLVLGGCIALLRALRTSGESRRSAVILLALAFPTASLLIYRNAFAYFYVSIIPAAAVTCGLVVAAIERRLANRQALSAAVVASLTLLLTAQAVVFFIRNKGDAVEPQRQVVRAVHEVFSEPVPYMDRCGMIASFPRVGPFMSTFVLSAYRDEESSLMETVVRREQPVFILANVSGFNLAASWDEIRTAPHRLLQEDFEYLRKNYVRHWGPIWVPGISGTASRDEDLTVEIYVSGPYTLQASADVLLDRRLVHPGQVVQLTAGVHAIRATDAAEPVTLRYGDHLSVPDRPPPSEPLFTGLGFRGVRL